MLNPNETCNLISFVYSQFSFSLFVLPFSKFYERLTFSLHVLHSSFFAGNRRRPADIDPHAHALRLTAVSFESVTVAGVQFV